MNHKNITFLEKSYIFLAAFFAVLVVTMNMVFQKYIYVPLSLISLEISAGVLLYPATLLISDIVTEIYGKKHANYMVNITILISIIIAVIISLFNSLDSTSWSPVDNNIFTKVFGKCFIANAASLVAVYISQLLDVSIFAEIKAKMHSKHLWFRNIVSTSIAQIVDTACITAILTIFSIIPTDQFINLLSGSLFFKMLSAVFSIPFCYLGRYFLTR